MASEGATPASGPSRGLGGDIDGLFGLLVDNLIQLLVILALLGVIAGDQSEVIFRQIIPAVGVSVILGNLFYAWQAWSGSRREGTRKTALPYGVNTPTVFAYILFIMMPVHARTGSWDAAYAAGMIACIGSGLIEFFGAFVSRWIRASTPRAAMLSALAGIALTFIAMDFIVRIFTDPLIGLVPLAILLAGYFGRARMPFGLPAGLVALVVGTVLAWGFTWVDQFSAFDWIIRDGRNLRSFEAVATSGATAGFYWPDPRNVWPLLQEAFLSRDWLSYLGVIIPMGLFNLVGSLQNLESAEAAGDSYATTPSLMVNGIGSIAGGLLGSCFPTTIYIGHPGWKGMGAGWAYSLFNAIAIAAVCLTGLVVGLEALVPITAGAAILLWIGVIITAQAFEASPKEHGGAVAVGLVPAIAGLVVMIAASPYGPGPGAVEILPPASATASDSPATTEEAEPGEPVEAGLTGEETAADEQSGAAAPEVRLSTIQEQLARETDSGATWAGFPIHGLVRLERGLLLISMIWAAVVAWMVDRKWTRAGLWALGAAALSLLGVIHGYAIDGNDLYYVIPGLSIPPDAARYPAWDFTIAYVVIGVALMFPSLIAAVRNRGEHDDQAMVLRRRMEEFERREARVDADSGAPPANEGP